MDFLFIVCWTLGFLGGIFLIWKRFVNRKRLFLLLLVNLFFLGGLFGFYPLVLSLSGIK